MGLGPAYALIRIMVLESLVRLGREFPGVVITNGKWITGLKIESYGQSPHVSDSSWNEIQNALHEAYVRGVEDQLGEVNCCNWPLCYG